MTQPTCSNLPDMTDLLSTLPPIVPRHRIEQYLPGFISKGYLANLDSIGTGPRKVRIGAKVGYLREDLIAWLKGRMNYDL